MWFMLFSVEDLHKFFKSVEDSKYGCHTEFSSYGFAGMEQDITRYGCAYCTFFKTLPPSYSKATLLPDHTVIRRRYTTSIENLTEAAKIYLITDLIQES